MNEYRLNRETGKIELHFDKADYQALSAEQKQKIKSAFLWSNYGKCWVSRTKEPNNWRAKEIAESLGLTNAGKVGERLSFAEQMEQKQERAERRAARMDEHAENAMRRSEALQKPINDMRGDIAFFTQPNINTSSGRTFTNRRNKMFAAYERGFDEYRKSEYFRERAETARATAKAEQLKDKAFIDRRIKEADKDIRQIKKAIEANEKILADMEHEKSYKGYDGTPITAEQIQERNEDLLERMEAAMDKLGFYKNCLDDLGGVQFSQDNIKVGYIVEIARWGKCEVVGKGRVNITFKILTGGAAGGMLKAAYAEIKQIISTEQAEKAEQHPFVVGDSFNCRVWDGEKFAARQYDVIKVTDKTVTLKSGEDKPINRKPRKLPMYRGEDAARWAITIADGHDGTIYKQAQ